MRRTRLMATLAIAAGLLASGQALSNETHSVACSAGETIAAALSQAHPGDTITMTGTCNGTVMVDVDGITLDGGGSGVVDGLEAQGCVVSIVGHQNVVLKGLTIQGGSCGIHADRGASVVLADVTASGHDEWGILVTNSSHAVLTGAIVVDDNAMSGINVWQDGHVLIAGNFRIGEDTPKSAAIQVNGNGGSGMTVGLKSSLRAETFAGNETTNKETAIQANGNDGSGIAVMSGSSAQLGGGLALEADNNGQDGLWVQGSSAVVLSGWGTASTASFKGNGSKGITVTEASTLNVWHGGASVTTEIAENKGHAGLEVSRGSSVSFEPVDSLQSGTASYLVIKDNEGSGISINKNSSGNMQTAADISSNDSDGIQVSDYSYIKVGDYGKGSRITGNGGVGIRVNWSRGELRKSTITGNTGADVRVQWESWLDWESNSVGTVDCDAEYLGSGCADESN